MPGWNDASAAQFRNLESEQRKLASDATCTATRDIHLEFAEKYRAMAEQLEAQGVPVEAERPASSE